MPIRLLLVDDHALFRDSLAQALSREGDLEIAASCGTVREAIVVVQQVPVDIVLLDYELGMDRGIEGLPLAKECEFPGRVLVVTAGLPDSEVRSLLTGGISGIIHKGRPIAALLDAIRTVARGVTSFEERYLHLLARAADGPRDLSEGEMRVLRRLVGGMANKEIATALGSSETSIKATLQRIFEKTGVRSRTQLIRLALDRYKDLL